MPDTMTLDDLIAEFRQKATACGQAGMMTAYNICAQKVKYYRAALEAGMRPPPAPAVNRDDGSTIAPPAVLADRSATDCRMPCEFCATKCDYRDEVVRAELLRRLSLVGELAGALMQLRDFQPAVKDIDPSKYTPDWFFAHRAARENANRIISRLVLRAEATPD